EGVIERVDDLIVHRPAELRVRVQDQRDRTIVRRFMVIAGFQTARRPIDDQFGHHNSSSRGAADWPSTPGCAAEPLDRPWIRAHPNLDLWARNFHIPRDFRTVRKSKA